MTDRSAQYSLFLYAESPRSLVISPQALAEQLQQIGFIIAQDNTLDGLPGNNLMEYVTFLGCSPALQRGEVESQVRLHHAASEFALGGESVVVLRYPDCRHVIDDAAQIVRNYPQPWHCPQCRSSGEFDAINWRRSAAVSRLFIEISQIFPKEAVPSDKLLEFLLQQSASQWNWFYARSTFG